MKPSSRPVYSGLFLGLQVLPVMLQKWGNPLVSQPSVLRAHQCKHGPRLQTAALSREPFSVLLSYCWRVERVRDFIPSFLTATFLHSEQRSVPHCSVLSAQLLCFHRNKTETKMTESQTTETDLQVTLLWTVE